MVVRTPLDIDETAIEELVETKHIAKVASLFYQQRLAAAGLPGTASVDCAKPRIVALSPKSSLTCALTATGTWPLVLRVRPGPHGELKFDVPRRPRASL
jgi:hypothetical protein